MRSGLHANYGFFGGVAVGLALAGVTLLTVAAVRRARSRRRMASEHVAFIDGVRPPNEVELDVRPAAEANSMAEPRLESEAPDVPILSQRW